MEDLEEDTLYLAATRPALVAGIPLPLAGALLMLAGLIIVFFKKPTYEVVMIPLWLGCRVMVARDYNAANVVLLALRTIGRSLDTKYWGGASVSPHPIAPSRHGRGML